MRCMCACVDWKVGEKLMKCVGKWGEQETMGKYWVGNDVSAKTRKERGKEATVLKKRCKVEKKKEKMWMAGSFMCV